MRTKKFTLAHSKCSTDIFLVVIVFFFMVDNENDLRFQKEKKMLDDGLEGRRTNISAPAFLSLAHSW